MNNNINEELNNLNVEESLSGLAILITIGSIVGDELVKKYYITKSKVAYKTAKLIFIISLIVTILIYIYFAKKNKKEYYEKLFNEESNKYLIRLIGSCLIVAGFICLLYFRIVDNELEGEELF